MAKSPAKWTPPIRAALGPFAFLYDFLSPIFGPPFAYLVIHYRPVFAVLFLLPMSVAFEFFFYFMRTNPFLMWLQSSPNKHYERVKMIQDAVKEWKQKDAAQGKRMCTGRPGWLTMSMRVGKYKSTFKNVPTHLLHDVLEVNPIAKTVRVEPCCSMGQISKILQRQGWSLAVTPELDELTVGGLINGFGIESSSHKYGLFQYIVESMDVVTADGELVHCSRNENSELFYLLPWSHGTLALLVCAELKIVPSKRFVHLRYFAFKNQREYCDFFEAESRKGMDDVNNAAEFVEGLVYSDDDCVVMLGNFADKPSDSSKINDIGVWHKPWFYQHAKSFLNTPSAASNTASRAIVSGEEYVPLRSYYHRHTKSIFWEVEEIIPIGNHPVFRWLLGWAVPPKISLLKLTETEFTHRMYEEKHVAQDMLVPIKDLQASIQIFKHEFDFYPLWICPMRVYQTPLRGLVNPAPIKQSNGKTAYDEMFVDIGCYGTPKSKNFHAKDSLRRVEEFVREKNGFQALYADTYMTRDEFRVMFDHEEYDKLRKKLPLCEKAFPEIYDKISKDARK